MNVQIFVASHKPYWICPDPIYTPILVGAAERDSFEDEWARDDVAENISQKNPTYCELTALYWAWKNSKADYVGLCHYRRYFAAVMHGEKQLRILGQEHAERLVEKVPIVLPKKRNYVIETNYSQYAHAHHAQDLDVARDILGERWPEYLPAFDAVMRRTSGHRFNMMIMRRDVLDRYCTWLFDVLFELERRLDITGYSANDQRVFGFVAERLLDVWIETEQIGYQELPVVNLENQHWPKKILAFLKRKFFGKGASA